LLVDNMQGSNHLKKVALLDSQCVPALFEIACDAAVEEEVSSVRARRKGEGTARGERAHINLFAGSHPRSLSLLRNQIHAKGFKQWKAQTEELRVALKARALDVVVAEISWVANSAWELANS
jgi:hypothetical protein